MKYKVILILLFSNITKNCYIYFRSLRHVQSLSKVRHWVKEKVNHMKKQQKHQLQDSHQYNSMFDTVSLIRSLEGNETQHFEQDYTENRTSTCTVHKKNTHTRRSNVVFFLSLPRHLSLF